MLECKRFHLNNGAIYLSEGVKKREQKFSRMFEIFTSRKARVQKNLGVDDKREFIQNYLAKHSVNVVST